MDVPQSKVAAVELKRELDYYQLPSGGCLHPPSTSSAQIVEVVQTICHNNRDSWDPNQHKGAVEAKLRANPLLKIVSTHINQWRSITTILATPNATAASPSPGGFEDFARIGFQIQQTS